MDIVQNLSFNILGRFTYSVHVNSEDINKGAWSEPI
jgi:hypothetical protein